MSEFRTTFDMPVIPVSIDYCSHIMFMGSCFTENIGEKMQELRFATDINPFGIIYNPYSVANSLDQLIKNKKYKETDVHFHNGLWFSYYHHSRFSHPDATRCIENINNRIEASRNFLEETDVLFVTFGTAWIYKRKKDDEVVSNCHKVPAVEFNRVLMEVDEITALYADIIGKLRKFNPSLKIVITVSPVRHWKDGAAGNQVSKAVLILATQKIVSAFEDVYYFPAYEIMMDDLRDYRFYDADMLHPNDVAIDYIWKKFSSVFFEKKILREIQQVGKVLKSARHKVFNTGTPAHKNFLQKLLDSIHELEKQIPCINLGDIQKEVQIQLKTDC